MKSTFIFLFLFCILLLSSCGKKEESEFTDEKTPNNQTDQSYKKDTSKVNPFEQKSESKTSEDKTSHTLTPEKTISALEAANNVGRIVAVRGFVAEVKKTENVEYLDFVEKYPENPFTGVIFKSKFDEIGDISVYENKNVEITGLVSTYKGKPQIVIVNKNQIKIID